MNRTTLDVVFGKSGVHALIVDTSLPRRKQVQKDLGFFDDVRDINVTAPHVRHWVNGKVVKEIGRT